MKWSRTLIPTLCAFSLCYIGATSVRAQNPNTNRATIQISHPQTGRPAHDEPSSPLPGSVPLQPELRIKAIGQRIDIIKEIIAQKQAQAAKAAEKTPEPDPELTPVETAPPELEPSSDGTAPPSPTDNTPSVVESKDALKLPNQAKTKDLADFPINTSPMNSMELANSLFITGHYDQARKGYEALLAAKQKGIDQEWLRCLAANCYRVQGDFSNAEKLYRQVAATKRKSYPTDQAKWYLDHLTRRKKIKADLELLDAELQSLQPKPTEPEKAEPNQSQHANQGDE